MRKFSILLIFALIAPLSQAAPATEEVIAKAREYLGGDSALDGIRSIYYEAEFTTAEDEKGTVKIYFQKPLQQRVEVAQGDFVEVTALNDFDGWRKTYDKNDRSRWQLRLLDIGRIRELQANTWENLNFFHGIERRRGWIENGGVSEMDGRECVKLVFHHPREIKFTRYFDAETGRLLRTRTNDEAEIREEGEMRVSGILFPEKLTTYRDGEVLNTIRFREIRINDEFEDSLFDVPSLKP